MIAKYHVRDNGEPGKCTAQPGQCPVNRSSSDEPETDHYDSPESARAAYEKSQEGFEIEPLTARKVSAAKNVNRALTAPLIYDGEKPQWFLNIADKAEEMWGTGSETRILDVIDSPIGQLAVVWEPRSLDEKERVSQFKEGWNLSDTNLFHMETGERVGYLKMCSINDRSFDESFGSDSFSSFRYLEISNDGFPSLKMTEDIIVDESDPRFTIANMGKLRVDRIDLAESNDEKLEAKKELWLSAYKAMKVLPKNATGISSSWQVAEMENIPEDESLIDQDLEQLSKVAKRHVNKIRFDYRDPFVDFARVTDERLKGTGLGSAMYVYTARVLAEEGNVLRGSGVQTIDSKSVWKKFSENKSLPVKTVTGKWRHINKKREIIELDFRKPAEKRPPRSKKK